MTRGQFSVSSVAFCLLGLTAVLPLGTVSEAYAQTTGYQPQSPVVAAADRINPWGALAKSSPFAPSPDGGGDVKDRRTRIVSPISSRLFGNYIRGLRIKRAIRFQREGTMLTRGLFLLIFFMAAATTFFSGAPTAWADTTCTGVMNGATPSTIPGFSGLNALSTLNGNVTVPSGASCTLMFYNVTGNVQAKDNANLTLVYVNVSGNVQVQNGGTLVINAYNEPSTVGGNVQAHQCKSALLQGNVTVGGNVQIQQCTGAGPNGFQGPGIVINGNFQCKANASNATPCLAWLGKVHGDVQIESNVAPTAPDVSLVTVGGNLQCQHNSQATTHMHGPSWVDGNSQDQCAGFATTSTSISSGPVAPAASCAALAALPAAGFPVPSTVIVSAVDSAAGGGLPERCIVTGFINDRISMVDSCEYQDRFQVALPLPAAWNGRFFAEGGGGTEGSVPAPTGANSGSGSAASNFGIVNGYAVANSGRRAREQPAEGLPKRLRQCQRVLP